MSITSPRLYIPIAAQLAIGFLLVVFIPVLVVTSIIMTSNRNIDRTNIETFTRQNGQRQRQAIASSLSRAEQTASNFTEDASYNQILVGALLADTQVTPALTEDANAAAVRLMQETLLNPASGLYKDARLLNQQGKLIAIVDESNETQTISLSDETPPEAFQEIVQQREENAAINQIFFVTRPDEPIIEIINTVKLRETENVIGYLIVSLNLDNIIIPNLTFSETNNYPAYSFIISRNGVIISPESDLTQIEDSRNTEAVDLAFQGEQGFDFYPLNSGAGEEVGGYYTPIENTPFTLITQVATANVLRQSQDAFQGSLFALIVGGISLALIMGIIIYGGLLYAPPINQLQTAMQKMAIGNFNEPIPSTNRPDEFGKLARNFVDMREQTHSLIQELEMRIAQRNRDIATTQEISHYAVTQRNLNKLMDDVVNLIVERFPNIYHAQIFLVDKENQYAILRASTGSVGNDLLARGHRLVIGSLSVIGQVTAQGEIIVARDTTLSEVHRHNEFLPDTRSELAIPLRIGDNIIGALDVQSKASITFDENQINVLQTMAQQIAIAIENTRLYQDSIQRLRNIEQQTREETVRAWQEYMFDNRTQRLVRQAGNPTELDMEKLRERALITKKPVLGNLTDRNTIPIAVPLQLRGENIGVVAWELPGQDYSSDKIQLAQELADRLSVSLDNARLFEQSQRATERERLVNEISAKLTAETDINEILQMAVREVGQALRAPEVSIRLKSKTTSQSSEL